MGPESSRPTVRLIVLGSLLAGAVVAGVLTLVVFGGSAEPVITGAGLLGFAVGWALLALLSIRLTDQPQRWALLPAAAMALTGVGLIVIAPGDRGLSAAGWVWPPLLLGLALWIGLRATRSLPRPGGGRWVLYPVVALMGVAAVGGILATAAPTLPDDFAMPGRTLSVGDHRLHLDCRGSSQPTVVLLSGQGEFSAHWSLIAPAVARSTRVCAYDRAGQGWSDDVARPQSAAQVADDLQTLLHVAGEDGPFVVAGHSIGGAHAMVFAARHPDQVAGLVILDSSNPYAVGADTPPDAADPGPIALLPSLARLGLGSLFPDGQSDLPEPAATHARSFGASPRGWRNSRDDFATMPALFAQAQTLTTLDRKPLVVITTTGEQHADGFEDAHRRIAALSGNSSHRYSGATHAGLLVARSGAEDSTRAVEDVVEAVRSGSPVRPG